MHCAVDSLPSGKGASLRPRELDLILPKKSQHGNTNRNRETQTVKQKHSRIKHDMNSSSMIICHSELDESVRNTDNYMRVYIYTRKQQTSTRTAKYSE